jgi:hypothetical protein
MAKRSTGKTGPTIASKNKDPFRRRKDAKPDPKVHVLGKGFVCDTEQRGFARPHNRSTTEIVVDASEGFIPLWAKNTIIRWRFREQSLQGFENVNAAKNAIRQLLGEALLAWGDAAPVKFAERQDAWDFEIVVKNSDDCDATGCVLASAFFPDGGRHKLYLYPILFNQERKEQVGTLCHEIGHVFGLRHFFAQLSELDSPSEIFGTHKPFSIMNYGDDSVLTTDDKSDLKRLYELVWSGQLTQINGTPIRIVQPFHTAGFPIDSAFTLKPVHPVLQTHLNALYGT